MSDQKILDRLYKGDYKAFKFLYEHYGMVENYILKNNGSKEDAKDIFQNALVVFYENIQKPEFTITSKISTYLYSISKNLWLKKMTRNKEDLYSNSLKSIYINSSKIEAEELLEEPLDISQYLANILKKLGNPCKPLIVCFHFDKLSWDEIALKLNYKTAHAARNQKYKCFLKIRKMIPVIDKIKLFSNGE